MEAKDYLSGVYLDNHKFSKEDTIKLMEDYYNYRVEYERQKQLKNLNIPVVSKMLPELEECNQASYVYADKHGKGEFGLVRVAYQEGINWALNYLTKRK